MNAEPTATVPVASEGSWKNRADLGWMSLLGALALTIWLRDTSWMGSLDETLPLLVALPLFAWFGVPWRRRPQALAVPFWVLVGGALLFVAGIVLDFTTLLTAGWMLLLWGWLGSRLEPRDWAEKHVLLILPAMAFPWLVLEGRSLGWIFRLSAAAATEWLYATMQFPVTREGTQIIIYGAPIGVDAACSGLNALQSMLIAGALVAQITLGSHARIRWTLPLLVAVAWTANTLRVAIISGIALTYGHEVASGWIHASGGWLLLVLMFALCTALFNFLRPSTP